MICVIAAGGNGTRLAPATRFVNKHLVTVGKGKLMIDYPLQHMADLGFKEVQLITGTVHAGQISDYVKDGEAYGLDRIDYRIQPVAAGIADCLRRVSHLIKAQNDGVLLILGDNFFECPIDLSKVHEESLHAHCWEYDVGTLAAAKAFGQVLRDELDRPCTLVEKPEHPQSSKIVTGIYYFPSDVWVKLEKLSPSRRNELEITDLLKIYAEAGSLRVHEVKGKWFDLGEWGSWSLFIKQMT